MAVGLTANKNTNQYTTQHEAKRKKKKEWARTVEEDRNIAVNEPGETAFDGRILDDFVRDGNIRASKLVAKNRNLLRLLVCLKLGLRQSLDRRHHRLQTNEAHGCISKPRFVL